ncbi:MAG: cytochrome b/b6 domain-containing protein [Acetobacteraceae bacterium]|jgi:cytochrome b561
MVRLSLVRRHLHWWTAVMVVLGFAIAWVMTALPLSALLMKFLLYQVHKSLGLCIAGLAVLRLLLTWYANDWPRGVRAVLYVLLLVVPLLGYLTAAASPNQVPTLFLLLLRVPHAIGPDQTIFDVIRPVHRWLAIALIGLAIWHAAQMSFSAFEPGEPVQLADDTRTEHE